MSGNSPSVNAVITLVSAGKTAADIRSLGYTAGDQIQANVPLINVIRAGYLLSDIKPYVSIQQMVNAQVPMSLLREPVTANVAVGTLRVQFNAVTKGISVVTEYDNDDGRTELQANAIQPTSLGNYADNLVESASALSYGGFHASLAKTGSMPGLLDGDGPGMGTLPVFNFWKNGSGQNKVSYYMTTETPVLYLGKSAPVIIQELSIANLTHHIKCDQGTLSDNASPPQTILDYVNANVAYNIQGSAVTTLNTVDYKVGNASLSLSRANLQYIDMSNKVNFSGTSGHSICFWFKTTPATAGLNYVHLVTFSASTNYANATSFILYQTGQLYEFTSGGSTTKPMTGITTNDNAWHHMVILFGNTTTRKVYIDGQLKLSYTFNAFNLNATGSGSRMGSASWDATENIDGGFDDIRLYSRHLTVTEIQQIYTNQIHAYQGHLTFPVDSGRSVGTRLYATAVGSPPAIVVGAGNFTVEAWVKYPSGTTLSMLSGGHVWIRFGSATAGITLRITSTPQLQVSMNNSLGSLSTLSFNMPAGAITTLQDWTHVAVVRTSNSLVVWVNGTQTDTSQSFSAANGNWDVGVSLNGTATADVADTESFGSNGFRMTGIRVSKTNRYTAAFTPKMEPFVYDNTNDVCLINAVPATDSDATLPFAVGNGNLTTLQKTNANVTVTEIGLRGLGFV